MNCPLCQHENINFYYNDNFRVYYSCPQCNLIFVAPEYYVSAQKEKARYDTHNNNPEDQRYRNFLKRVYDPLLPMLQTAAKGLDFGSGPGPTLSVMFEEAGFEMDIFDPFYANDLSVFSKKYDFITATEVVEHLKYPGYELDRLTGLLKPSGILAIMTKTYKNHESFNNWWYKDDITHIAFFSEKTFQWLARQWNAKLIQEANDVFIFRFIE